MSITLTPYLNFADTREAFTYYQEVFGGTLEISTFGEAGMDNAAADGVLHALLTTPYFQLMASDLGPEDGLPPAGSVSLALHGSDLETFAAWHARLGADGQAGQPLVTAPWGDVYGDAVDRYGIRWMFNAQPS